jgi:uncharacterized membrane protein
MNEINEQQQSNPKWTRRDWILLAINVVIFASFYFAFDDRLPEQVISHYNVSGEVDRTMAKGSFWLMYGVLAILLPSALSFLRYIDPRKMNYDRFNGYFILMRYAISLFLHGIFLFVILDNMDYDLPMLNLVYGGLGLLWIVIGNGMGQLRSNFFIGIRTPWTLTDKDNWRKTHRLSARLWVLTGFLMLISAFFLNPIGLLVALIVTIALTVVVPTVYSYMLYRRA